ncbi:MAG: sensor histidine kinase [Bacteroidetes bacterium]|nr:MAG: sensor histidine kinase [Bacteroidota bacterium]
MKKNILLYFFLFFVGFFSTHAESIYKFKVDSILKKYANKSDSFKFEKLRRQSVDIWEMNSAASDTFIRYAYNFAVEKKYYLGQAISFEIKASLARDKDNTPLAVENYLNAMDMYENYNLKNIEKITCLINLAQVLFDNNAKMDATEYADLAYKLIINLKNQISAHEIYRVNILASFYYKIGQFNKVFKLMEILYSNKFILNNKNIQVIHSQIIISNCYDKLNIKTKRDYYLNKAICMLDNKISKNSGIYFLIMNNLANYKIIDGKIDSAIAIYKSCLIKKTNIEDAKWVAINNRDIANAYLLKKDISSALKHALIYRNVSIKNKFNMDVKKSYILLSEIYAKQNRFEDAFISMKEISILYDSIYVVHQTGFIESLFAKHKLIYEEKLNIDLYKDIKNKEKVLNDRELIQRVLIILILFFLIFVVIISYFYIKNREKHKELKQLAEQIVEKNKTLENQNEKLYSLNNEIKGLTGIVSHDLKSPLNRVEALLKIVNGSIQNNNENKNYIDIAINEINDAKSLIANILVSSEKQHLNQNTESYNISDFLASILLDFALESDKKKIKINTFISQSVFTNVDQISFKRIVTNLVSNALKFSMVGDNIYIYLLDLGNTFKLSVKDEGPGLSSDEISNLFGKYNKLSAKPTGGESSTGLGLFIVKKLVDELDGEIYVQSKKGKGATFDVVLKKNNV